MESTNSRQACGEPKSCRIYQWHPEYNFWFEAQKSNEECNVTDKGASDSMDPDYCGHLESLGSKEWYMRYLTLLSDVDARTWTRYYEVVPYGKY